MSSLPPSPEPSHSEPSPPPAEPHDTFAGQGCLGSAALIFGLAVFCLAAVEEAGLPFRMPRSWYAHRVLWFFLAMSALAAAWALLRGTPPDTSRRRKVFDRVILYTRPGCHLCDEARLVLQRYSARLPVIEEIDIDSDPHLAERFGQEIPVVEIDGTIRFRGRVNEILLRRLIAGRQLREVV